MGNCLNCFKEPPPAAPDNNTSHCHKEDMPEAEQYAAAAVRIPSTATSIETSLISNGNHVPGAGTAAVPAEPVPNITRFYQYGRRPQVKPTPVMGVGDSKPSDAKLNGLFDLYKDDEDSILEDGIEQLCKDLQVSPDEFKVLVLAWKLNAEQMCRFTRPEFVGGLRKMRVDSVRTLQQRLPEVVRDVEKSDEAFKSLYRFTFKFGLDSAAGQRILPVDVAVVLWRLVFTVREPPILSRWLAFLKNHEQYRGIPKDTWNMFLNFSDTVGNDLSSYDDTEAWPSLFDDFVEYENDQANQNVTKDKECESLIITKDD